MKLLQKLGKSLMLPVACLPVCGLLMGLGYWLCPVSMQGGEITGFAGQVGFFLVRAGGALLDNIALLFAVGVGVGFSEKHEGTGALASIASFLIITNLLGVRTIEPLLPAVLENPVKRLAFENIANPFVGILAGVIGSLCFNRFKDTKLPEWLAFFGGKRCVTIVAGLASVAVSGILLFVWPLLFEGLHVLGKGIVGLGNVGAGIYAALNRLLIPVGLHHALNNVFWFDTIGLGDLTHFWAGHTSADVSWSLGMYMSGFFPCMMFGVPGAALAIVRCAKPEKRKAALGLLLSTAICAFLCGVTEPFEFSFMFISPILYALYSLLYGLVTILTVALGFRAGFCFSAGATDLLFSASLPAAAKTWLILPLGALSFGLFYLAFRIAIPRLDLKTPGREEEEERTDGQMANAAPPSSGGQGGCGEAALKEASQADSTLRRPGKGQQSYEETARAVLQGIGGRENLLSVDNCVTRLRLEIRDPSLVDEKGLKAFGIPGVIKTGPHSLQVVIGTRVQFVAEELEKLVTSHT